MRCFSKCAASPPPPHTSHPLPQVDALDPPADDALVGSNGIPGAAGGVPPPGTTHALVQRGAASLLGLLIRHASSVPDQLAGAGLLGALSRSVAQRTDVPLQRKGAAALGELLFYVASQQRDARAAAASPWQPGPEVQQRLLALLQPGEDEVAQVGRVCVCVCGGGG